MVDPKIVVTFTPGDIKSFRVAADSESEERAAVEMLERISAGPKG